MKERGPKGSRFSFGTTLVCLDLVRWVASPRRPYRTCMCVAVGKFISHLLLLPFAFACC